MAEVVTKFGVTFTQHLTTPVFTTTDAHGLSVDDLISVTKTTEDTAGATDNITGVGTWIGEPTNGWEYNSGTEYTIATVPSDTTFTLTVDLNTIGDTSERKIEYHPLEVTEKEVVEEEVVESSGLQWEQFTLGQNKVIQDIGAAAAKASALVEANATFAKTTLETGKVLLMGLLNPQLLLLVAIADEIDKFVEDFKGTGFYILEIVPTGNEILPKDVDGNPIAILFSPIGLTFNYGVAAAAGMGGQFISWLSTISGGETDPLNLKKSSYAVKQGKSLSEADRTENANDDLVSGIDGVFGFPKMNPSTIISQIIAAMDEEADINRPNFSSSAEVAAIVIIIGFPDLTKNIKSLKTILEAFLTFFGGDEGLFTKGLRSIFEIVKAGVDNLEKGADAYKSVIKVSNVSGVRGTDPEDKLMVNTMGIDYNYEAVFEEGDLVVGPIRMFGGTAGKGRAMGIVSKAETTTNDPYEPYSSQELTLTCLSETDQHAFNHLSNGNQIQRVAYYKNQKTHIDQNTGETIVGAEFNDYKYMQDLTYELGDVMVDGVEQTPALSKLGTSDELFIETQVKTTIENLQTYAKKAQMKVTKEKGKTLLKVGSLVNIAEEHTFTPQDRGGEQYTTATTTYGRKTWWGKYQIADIPKDYKTKNEVMGKIDRPKVAVENKGIPPNFKKAKLEDLMDDLKTFFFQIQKFTNDMRDFAAGATEELQKVIDYIDGKIEEIEELNKSIQAILALFQLGIPDAGVYVLSIPTTTGGNAAIKEALSSATNGPPNTLDYSVGFMMMGGGPSMKPLQLLLGG